MFLIDVTEVRALENRNLDLTFADGLHAVVAMDQVIEHYSGVFAALMDDSFFRQVRVTVSWAPSSGPAAPTYVRTFCIRSLRASRSSSMASGS